MYVFCSSGEFQHRESSPNRVTFKRLKERKREKVNAYMSQIAGDVDRLGQFRDREWMNVGSARSMDRLIGTANPKKRGRSK